MNNTLANAKRDFKIGYLTKFRIERSPLGAGWLLSLGERNSEGWLVEARTKEARTFKTLDSVIATLEAIGFEVNALS